MGMTIGMRGKDLQKFLITAREKQVIILVRHTNDSSLRYVGLDGYYPKPAAVKAKTADFDPPQEIRLVNGHRRAVGYKVAGLVVHPGFQPRCFAAKKVGKAADCWLHTMEVLAPSLMHTSVDPTQPDSWSIWGVTRTAAHAPRWKWRVDIDPASQHFGCLQLNDGKHGWCYIHGDYDLKDVIVPGHETDNRRQESKLDGVTNFTPVLFERQFSEIQTAVNTLIGVDMVQHGAEAQFAWHGDEPITVAFPDWSHLLLMDAVTVQGWYANRNREVLAKMGTNYAADRSRMYFFGPQGTFAPGMAPLASWG